MINRQLLERFLYDYPFQPATGFWRAVEIDKLINTPFPKGFGLDLGCGDGKLTKIILEYVGNRELVGVDIDPAETAQAKETGLYARIHTVPADKIPEADDTFDFVISNSVLEHIDNIEDVIRETSRLLKQGGIFVFTVPSDTFHACLQGPLLPWKTRKEYEKELDLRCAHKRYWGERDWDKILSQNGLKITRALPYLSKKQLHRWENISRFTAGILFSFYGKKTHPIEIQRSLGMRKATQRLPKFISIMLASFFSIGMTNSDTRKGLNSCLLITAVKL